MKQTPVDLLNELFGRWQGYEFKRANFHPDAIDLSLIESAINASTLTERQKIVLVSHFICGEKYTDIGKRYKVCGQQARSICLLGIVKLRHPWNMRHIKRAVSGWFNYVRIP